MATTSALLTNNASGTLSAGILSTDLSLTLNTGQGALFPNPGAGEYFYVTLTDGGATVEIVKCTARSGDTLTIVRAQDGTTASAFSTGNVVELRPIAELFREKVDRAGDTMTGALTVPTLIFASSGSQTKNGITGFKTTTYTSGSGTFTTDAKTIFAQIFVTGGGGGGGAADGDGASAGAAGGGAGGGTAIGWLTAAQLGATASYSVGAAGAAGSGNGGNGGTGGNSTFTPSGTGGVLTGNGGTGGNGTGSAYGPTNSAFNGGSGGTASGGLINHTGEDGLAGLGIASTSMKAGNGGGSYHGGGAAGPCTNNVAANVAGVAAVTYGAGGSGAMNYNTTASQNGGAGAAGAIIVIEYLGE